MMSVYFFFGIFVLRALKEHICHDFSTVSQRKQETANGNKNIAEKFPRKM